MKEKVLLILRDEEIILSQNLRQKIYSFKEDIEVVREKLQKILALSPKIPLYLLIDRGHQDLREAELPSLWIGDKLRLIYHKRQELRAQSGIYGYTYFKQDKSYYLRWISLPSNDPLQGWVSWISALSNPFLGAYFVSLEAGRFIKTTPHEYGMLIYNFSSSKTHHVIFKGERLLLFRPFSGEEDLKSSLHFLSRLYPDIHEKIHILNLNPHISLNLSQNIKVIDPDSLLQFLRTHKPTTLSLNINRVGPSLWMKKGSYLTFLLSLFLTGFLITQGISYQTTLQNEESKIAFLKIQLQARNTLLKNKNVERQRVALAHYHHLQSQQKDFFPILIKLASLLEKHHLHLKSFIWDNKDFEILFSLPDHRQDHLSNHFKKLLRAFSQEFPKGHLHILEGPFKSSTHETYKYPPELPSPMVHLRLEFP